MIELNMRNRMCIIMVIFLYNFTHSQGVETTLIWYECANNYSTGTDTTLGVGGFISYDPISSTVTENNFSLGYFVLPSVGYQIPYDIDFTDDEYSSLESSLLVLDKMNKEFSLKNDSTIIKRYNINWEYLLCVLTFRKRYLGISERYIPNFEHSNDNPNLLRYKKSKVPVYVIEIIQIEPYKKE